MATNMARNNPVIMAALEKNCFEHISLMAQEQVEVEFRNEIMQLQQMTMQMQQNPQMAQQLQGEIANKAAELIGELTEQYAQAVSPAETTDPLVAIRQQELALRGAEIQQDAEQFKERQQLEREKERNDALIAQQRLDLTEEATAEKTRVAEERIQTQRDIAAANLQRRM